MKSPRLLLLTVGLFLTTEFVLGGGSVQGTLVLEAMKPAPSRPGYVAPQTKKPVAQPEPAPAIVYLERDDQKYPPPRTGETVKIRQEGYQFRPAMVAVRTGTKVSFPNQDDEFHNVFSYSKAKRFDLGRFRKDETSPEERFDKPGLVKVYCEIHPHMRCLVLVLNTPWFVTTDASGKFTLKDVPPGEYWLRALQPSEKLLQQRVTVTEGNITTVEFAR